MTFTDPPLPPGAGFADEQLGGNVLVAVYGSTPEGYCIDGAQSQLGLALNVLQAPSLAAMRTSGVNYTAEISLPASTVYPLTIYPITTWQNTTFAGLACETRDGGLSRFNSIGHFGLGPLDYFASQPTSACCGFTPKPLVVPSAGAIVEAVDFNLIPAGLPNTPCAPPQTRFDVCALRATACYPALGERADALFQRRDALGRPQGPCP